MEDTFQYDKLVILNNVYQNALSETNILIQSPHIKTALYPHQSAMVQGMRAYRDKMIHGFVIGNRAINGKIGIIGDSYGSGKTLSALTYLATTQVAPEIKAVFKPTMTCELTPNSSTYFFSHDICTLSETSTNLIIVPSHLFNQWRHEIDTHTTLSYVPIETKKQLRGKQLTDTILTSSFVLTTNKTYKSVQEYASEHNIQWNNIIIDEASSIYMNSSDPPLKFQFLWLMTNNWIPLLFKHSLINKNTLLHLRNRVDLHPELEEWLKCDSVNSATYEGTLVSSMFLKEYMPFFHPHRNAMILRNSAKNISKSVKAIIISETIHCKPHISLQSLASFYLARNREPTIPNSSIPHLVQALGMECKSGADYITTQHASKHQLIKRKITDNECMICLEPCNHMTIVNCCHNTYCGSCLLRNTIMHPKCPTCREVLFLNSMCCLTPFEDATIVRTKTEICLELFKKNKENRFVIYSSFDNIYYQLFEEIDKLGLKAERIENNLFSQRKTLKKYKDGIVTILFVSNIEMLRGLSLLSTTHLIFYHEQPSFELKQVLIHSSQRLGRKDPLTILHLHSEIQV